LKPLGNPRVDGWRRDLRKGEESGIPGGEVKFIEPGRKAECEGNSLPLCKKYFS
jgi:hypothetical protein